MSFDTFSWLDFISLCPKAGQPIGDNTGCSFADFTVSDNGQALLDTGVTVNQPGGPYPVETVMAFRSHNVSVSFRAAYDYSQQRQEIVDISMPSPNRSMLGDDRVELIKTINCFAQEPLKV